MPATSFSTTPQEHQDVAQGHHDSFQTGDDEFHTDLGPDIEADTALLHNHHNESNSKPRRLDTRPGVHRHLSFNEDDSEPVAQPLTKDEPVSWLSLPSKPQLLVLTLARLSEPLAERSFAAYVFYQLRSFEPSLPDSTIASQGGLLTAAFAAAQFLTAVWWGRAADTPWIGRKKVLLVGLMGTCVSCVGIGFSKSFGAAVAWRVLGGGMNGNIGVMRTMISEIIKEKKFQSRAFLLLPMCFNVGVIIGPILGGFLAEPVDSFPEVFGPGSKLGGKNGVGWMTDFPYALPNLVSGLFILMGWLGVVLFLDETHAALRGNMDYGRRAGKLLVGLTRRKDIHWYTPVATQTPIDDDAIPLTSTTSTLPQPSKLELKNTLKPPPFRSIFTHNVSLTLLSHHLLAMHVSTFNTLIFLFLPAPTSPNTESHLPFLFTGGLGLSTEKVGLATAIIGVIGLPLQLTLYPRVSEKLGTLRSYRLFLPFSILAYTLIPFLALLPYSNLPSWSFWPILTVMLALQVLARTFTLPAQVLLVNNSSPSPAALGTIHGFAQSASSAGRTMGPVVGGAVLGWGLRKNCVGMVWWGMAVVAIGNWGLLWKVWEGDGKGGREGG